MGRFVKSVSFSLENDIEKELLQYAEAQGNFSLFIKGLIYKYMDDETKSEIG